MVQALSGVQTTLQRLDLFRNRELQIDQAGLDALLALPLLESLEMQFVLRSNCAA